METGRDLLLRKRGSPDRVSLVRASSVSQPTRRGGGIRTHDLFVPNERTWEFGVVDAVEDSLFLLVSGVVGVCR